MINSGRIEKERGGVRTKVEISELNNGERKRDRESKEWITVNEGRKVGQSKRGRAEKRERA